MSIDPWFDTQWTLPSFDLFRLNSQSRWSILKLGSWTECSCECYGTIVLSPSCSWKLSVMWECVQYGTLRSRIGIDPLPSHLFHFEDISWLGNGQSLQNIKSEGTRLFTMCSGVWYNIALEAISARIKDSFSITILSTQLAIHTYIHILRFANFVNLLRELLILPKYKFLRLSKMQV